MSGNKGRLIVAGLTVSLGAVGAWVASEGNGPTSVQNGVTVHHPYVPTRGDVPTIGHGSTHYEDGRRVKMSDPPITHQRAYDLAAGELDRTYAACVRRSLPGARMSRGEFDAAVDFAGQYGCGAWQESSMRRLTSQGQYLQACEAYKRYHYMNAGRRGPGPGLVKVKGVWKQDCSYPGNRVCMGVWTRQLERSAKCAKAAREAGS